MWIYKNVMTKKEYLKIVFKNIPIWIKNGLKYGYKYCCILHFITLWPFLFIIELNEKYMEDIDDIGDISHIPCPICRYIFIRKIK